MRVERERERERFSWIGKGIKKKNIVNACALFFEIKNYILAVKALIFR